MKPKHSTHTAGRAAYAPSSPTQESDGSASSSEETSATDASIQPQNTAFEEASENGLTVQEEQMIEEKFPEDPELSMRLYGRGRDAEMVRSSAVGENIDVTG
jgi:hypothetical protein